MANKITKLEVVEMMLANEEIVSNATFREYLENEKELLMKKKAKGSVSKAKQEENEALAKVVLDELSLCETPVTITELMKKSEKLNGYTNQKLTSIMKKLVNDELVVKTVDKKKSLFEVAEVVD